MLVVAACIVHVAAAGRPASKLERMDLDRWAKLREVERYQLQVAEKYYQQGNWKAAADEYEKFVTLYERSEGASFAQLKWSMCQVKLRHANTAIKDGFQTVIDYWPDTVDAVKAQYLIGRTWKEMGQIDKAKPALDTVVKMRGQHSIGVLALADLLDIAASQHDDVARAEYLKILTFDVPRATESIRVCRRAAEQYAELCFQQQGFEQAARALATNYHGAELFTELAARGAPWISTLAGDAKTRAQALQLASSGVTWCRDQLVDMPANDRDSVTTLKMWLAIIDLTAAAGQDDRVIDLYANARQQCGANDVLRGHEAAWMDRREQFAKAAEIYRSFDQPADGLRLLAASYRSRKLWQGAVDVYQELVALDRSRRPQFVAEICMTWREAGQYDRALDLYRQLLAEDAENSAKWLWEIGTTHRDARQWKQAIGVLRQCDNFPNNLMVMASCHRHLRQFREALLLYQQIGSDPAYAAWSAYQIGTTWEESGDKENAIEAFRAVCKRFPKTSQASRAHARLQQVYKISVTLGGALGQ